MPKRALLLPLLSESPLISRNRWGRPQLDYTVLALGDFDLRA
ncbi:hypothetical protein [Mycobacterium sp. AT1]|nr:hypothetical protein [Mycobacterium sp. AT1]